MVRKYVNSLTNLSTKDADEATVKGRKEETIIFGLILVTMLEGAAATDGEERSSWSQVRWWS